MMFLVRLHLIGKTFETFFRGLQMMFLGYMNKVKNAFHDQWGFEPIERKFGDCRYDGIIPDGFYPMIIDGKIDCVQVGGDRITCGNLVDITWACRICMDECLFEYTEMAGGVYITFSFLDKMKDYETWKIFQYKIMTILLSDWILPD